MNIKTISLLFALLVLCGGSVFSNSSTINTGLNNDIETVEDYNARALSVLKTVYQRYDALSSVTMDIDITIMDGDYSYKKSGTAIVKGEQFNLTTEDEKIISDGKTLWVYLKSDKSLQITNSTTDNQNFFCYPSKLLQKYQSSCEVKMVNETGNGYTVEFNPYNDDCPYETIKVSINKNYQITKITVLEADDMGYTISINNIKKNVNLSDNQFKFQSTNVQKSKVRDLRSK